MRRLGNSLRDLPPPIVMTFLRQAFSLPAGPARLMFNDILRPEKWHRKYIHKVRNNPEWWGAWIGEGVAEMDEPAILKRVEEADVLIFYVHGGGFRMGKCTMFMDRYIQWLNILKQKYNLNAMMMSVNHRLAPEFKYPSPVEDVVHAYEYVVNTLKVDMSKVVCIGDSSGGGVLLEMLFLTHDPSMFEIVTDDPESGPHELISELPRPAALILSSPMATDETDSLSWRENVKHDYISKQAAKVLIRDFFEAPSPDSPDAPQVLGVTKLQTGFRAFLPPTLMFVGNKEVLRDHALEMAAKAQDDGVHWETVMENYPHDWFMVPEVLKDRSVLKRFDEIFAKFIYTHAVAKRRNQAVDAMIAYRRPAEGLHALLERDERRHESDSSDYSDDEFHESFATTEEIHSIRTSMSRMSMDSKSTRSSKSSKSNKSKTLTILV